MSTKNDPAFPFVCVDISKTQCAFAGLTKLEFFAGEALKSLIASDYANYNDLASDAFSVAEAMIDEGEKRSK